MATVTFIGNGAADPSVVTAFGVPFRLNVPTQVDATIADRLKGNSHYRVEMTGSAVSSQPPVAPVAPNRLTDPAIQTLHDRAIAVGLRIDRRWSADRLADEVVKAETASAGA